MNEKYHILFIFRKAYATVVLKAGSRGHQGPPGATRSPWLQGAKMVIVYLQIIPSINNTVVVNVHMDDYFDGINFL